MPPGGRGNSQESPELCLLPRHSRLAHPFRQLLFSCSYAVHRCFISNTTSGHSRDRLTFARQHIQRSVEARFSSSSQLDAGVCLSHHEILFSIL